MLRISIRLIADAALVAILLFVSAGTLDWWRAWVLLAVMLFVRTVGANAVYRINPDLLRDRATLPIHHAQPRTDRLLLAGVLATGILGLPIVAGLDVFRWHLLPRPGATTAGFGLLLFALGWSVKSLALRANAFAVAVLRVQHDRSHAVADSGVYGVVRHPFYAADPLILVGLALWLESSAAALAAIVSVGLVTVRLRLEERFLRRELAGYGAYAERVRYRLVPGIW